MGNIDDYNARLAEIQAIPDEETRGPDIPVDVALQEAENLHHWSLDDAVALAVVGITTDMINDLPVRAGACREAQSIWNKDYRSQQEAQKEWAKQSPEAYAFRNDLLASFRFAFRKDDALLSRVSAIADGSGHADMIQDMNDQFKKNLLFLMNFLLTIPLKSPFAYETVFHDFINVQSPTGIPKEGDKALMKRRWQIETFSF